MKGAFRVEGDVLVFTPRHPFADGVTYAFVGAGTTPVLITMPSVERVSSTVVTGIYPSAAELPMNALRFYVHFSAPMSEGFAAGSVYLRDAETGARLDGAMLAMEPELWDRRRTRLTVLLEPGRIKRGLVPNTEAGYPLVPGRHVELVVDSGFEDASGALLVAAAQRSYAVGPARRQHVMPQGWTVACPEVGSTQPVRVRFAETVDHALGLRCLAVVDPSGMRVGGQAELAPGEQDWSFTPAATWGPGPYALLVSPELEDVAGNSVTRVFDRDLADPAHDLRPAEPVVLPLRLRQKD